MSLDSDSWQLQKCCFNFSKWFGRMDVFTSFQFIFCVAKIIDTNKGGFFEIQINENIALHRTYL